MSTLRRGQRERKSSVGTSGKDRDVSRTACREEFEGGLWAPVSGLERRASRWPAAGRGRPPPGVARGAAAGPRGWAAERQAASEDFRGKCLGDVCLFPRKAFYFKGADSGYWKEPKPSLMLFHKSKHVSSTWPAQNTRPSPREPTPKRAGPGSACRGWELSADVCAPVSWQRSPAAVKWGLSSSHSDEECWAGAYAPEVLLSLESKPPLCMSPTGT